MNSYFRLIVLFEKLKWLNGWFEVFSTSRCQPISAPGPAIEHVLSAVCCRGGKAVVIISLNKRETCVYVATCRCSVPVRAKPSARLQEETAEKNHAEFTVLFPRR